MGLKDWAAHQVWDSDLRASEPTWYHCGVVGADVGEMHLLQLLVKCHLEFIILPLFLSPLPSPSPLLPPLSLSMLPRLMAVEDELRGGPVIEPKTRIFADQVCETASSLVESVRWPVLSSLPPPLPLSPPPATVIILSAVCMRSPLIVLPCP